MVCRKAQTRLPNIGASTMSRIAPGSTVFLYTDGLTEAETARADKE
ncbi:MAG: SpoIIE family protein phosphatase [Prevotella sp.]|nr:SpoIIE family protein phosphatase [Prevotella sp.]